MAVHEISGRQQEPQHSLNIRRFLGIVLQGSHTETTPVVLELSALYIQRLVVVQQSLAQISVGPAGITHGVEDDRNVEILTCKILITQ